MLFLGTLASPREVSPIQTIQSLWNGSLPAVENPDDMKGLLQCLIDELWNGQIIHRDRSNPVHLQRLNTKPDRKSLLKLARTRREELDGFAEGLFGPEDDVPLPERASEALNHIGDIRALFFDVEQMLLDESITTSPSELRSLLKNLQQITRVAEKELHVLVISCAKARQAST